MKDITTKEICELIGYPANRVPVLLDIGSYDGSEMAEISEYYGRCEIHCFEADQRSAEFWRKKNSTDKNMHLWQVAICNKDWQKIMFHRSDSDTRRHDGNRVWSASSSIRLPKTHLEVFPDVEFNFSEEVDASTLDMWYWFHTLGARDLDTIDFIWCDVNGAEEDVILGAKGPLRNTRFLYIEFSNRELYEGQINKEKLLSLLPDFEEIGEYNVGPNFGNVLLKNKKIQVELCDI